MGNPLSRQVLVLNRLWQAVNIVCVKRAFSLLMQDHAQVLYAQADNFLILKADEWIDFSLQNPPQEGQHCIHTVRYRLRIPPVLLLRHYDRIPVKQVKFNRDNIFQRDGYRCQYCSGYFSPKELNLDHVIPRTYGGKTTWENIVTSCIQCNSRKADRLPHQAGMRLIAKPTRPRWRPFVSLPKGSVPSPEWQYFSHF